MEHTKTSVLTGQELDELFGRIFTREGEQPIEADFDKEYKVEVTIKVEEVEDIYGG